MTFFGTHFSAALLLWLAASSSFLAPTPTVVEAVRGSSTAGRLDFLQSVGGTDRRILQQMTSSTKNGGGPGVSDGGSGSGSSTCQEGKCPEDYLSLLSDQCYICTPWDENKVRPASITVLYLGGTGGISRYQSEDKTTCRDQGYPDSGTVTVSADEGGSGTSYPVSNGQVVTFLPPDGDEFGANTYFAFSNNIACYIHTSCSQPLVGGDQIGPFVLLQANDCNYAYCGDAIVNGNETCDEGAAMPSATCRNCTTPICGDGILDTNMGEVCDEGVAMPTDTCADCAIPDIPPVCGDGIVDEDMGETCDNGEANGGDADGCRTDCTSCGDNVVNGGEECDGTALVGGEQVPCRDDCTIPSCGDGIVDEDMGETCDDGSDMPSDTCVDCAIPDATPVCGDGIVDEDMGETCDNGEANGGDADGCRTDCTSCGDNVVNGGEECDGTALVGGEQVPCRDDCTIPSCGDGIVDEDMGETCDDGSDMPSDTCVDCAIPDATPVCGDGIVDEDMGETCDNGEANGGDADGCRTDCTSCGDNVVNGGEECDGTALVGGEQVPCRDDCTIPSCGDGIVDEDMGETCDDGSDMPSDTCVDCAIPDATPVCGDGIVDEGEECDEGADSETCVGCVLQESCVCGAEATYDEATGAVTIDFDMCGSEPLKSDFVGIYPCDEATKVADQDWWDNKVCKQFPAACGEFDFGYEEDKVYVGNLYKWFSWTCQGSESSPYPTDGGCQTEESTVWPESGRVVLDPNRNGTNWAFLGGRTLAPGCYKAILQREMYFISPPPYPDICPEGWEGALEFTVPASSSTSVSPLEQQSDRTAQSGSSSILSTVFVSLVLMVTVYFVGK